MVDTCITRKETILNQITEKMQGYKIVPRLLTIDNRSVMRLQYCVLTLGPESHCIRQRGHCIEIFEGLLGMSGG